MKLLTPFAAIIAVVSAGHLYSRQVQPAPVQAYADSAEVYQSALELQQQGLYSEELHAHSAQSEHGGDDAHAYAGHSRPAEKTPNILSFQSERDGHGYKYAYETENGIKAQEVGQIGGHEEGTQAHGAYSYTGDDGHVYSVTYTADEHGFHAHGDHLPTPPPVPEAIARSLEQNAKDEAAGIFDDGKYAKQSHQHEQSIQQHEQSSIEHQHPPAETFQYESAGFQHDEFQPTGHQLVGHRSHVPAGFQRSAHESYQPSAHQSYQPSGYHMMNVPVEGYRKH